MILSFSKKEQIVHKLSIIAKNSVSAVLSTVAGVTVNETTQLRREVRSVDTSCIYVIRNTLLRRIIENTVFVCLKDILINQNIIAFSNNSSSDFFRIFVNFSKKNKNFQIKGVVCAGKFVDVSYINLLSNLPTYKESLRNLVVVIKINSIGNLVRVLHVLSMQK